jgi:hypothetical protein
MQPEVSAMVEGMVNAKEARLLEMMRAVMSEQLEPLKKELPVIQQRMTEQDTKIGEVSVKVDQGLKALQSRMDKLEAKPPVQAAGLGASGKGHRPFHNSCEFHEADVEKAVTTLRLEFATLVKDSKMDAAKAALDSAGTTLETLQAKVGELFKRRNGKSTLTLVFDCKELRDEAKEALAPFDEVAQKWDDKCTYKGEAIMVRKPQPRFWVNRDTKLYEARKLVAKKEGKSEQDYTVDRDERTVKLGTAVKVQQSEDDWSVTFA